MSVIYNVFLGGDKLKYPWDNWMDNDQSDKNAKLEYAAHLKRTNYTVPFFFSRFAPHWNNWFVESGMTDLANGDGFKAFQLAAGSQIKQLVFHNKTALPGTTVALELSGVTGKEPADVVALNKAVETAQAAYEKAHAASVKAPDDADLKAKATEAKTKVDEANKALQEATETVIATHEVDLSKVGYFVFDINEFLQTNGDLTIIKKAGTFESACFSEFVEVNDFSDEHQCHCGVLPCDTDYPDALCTPQQTGTRLA